MLRLTGPVIISGQSGTAHCSDDTWKEQFEYCMNCAIEHDIWKHYGEGVTHAADACNTAIELKLNGTAVANPLETASSTTASETTAAAAASVSAPSPSSPVSSTAFVSFTDPVADVSSSQTPTNDDSAASHMTSSSVGILFAMIAAAGLL